MIPVYSGFWLDKVHCIYIFYTFLGKPKKLYPNKTCVAPSVDSPLRDVKVSPGDKKTTLECKFFSKSFFFNNNIFLFKMLVTFLLQKPKLLMKYFILIFSYIIKILSNNII